jgi:hypothetical protein
VELFELFGLLDPVTGRSNAGQDPDQPRGQLAET